MLPAGNVATSEPIIGHTLPSIDGLRLGVSPVMRWGIQPVTHDTFCGGRTQLKRFLAGRRNRVFQSIDIAAGPNPSPGLLSRTLYGVVLVL
jgi:hypothetical protein